MSTHRNTRRSATNAAARAESSPGTMFSLADVEARRAVVDQCRAIVTRAVIRNDVSLMLLTALLQLLLGLGVSTMQRWILNAMHAEDGTNAGGCLPVTLDVRELLSVFDGIEHQQVTIAVRRIDRFPARRVSQLQLDRLTR